LLLFWLIHDSYRAEEILSILPPAKAGGN